MKAIPDVSWAKPCAHASLTKAADGERILFLNVNDIDAADEDGDSKFWGLSGTYRTAVDPKAGDERSADLNEPEDRNSIWTLQNPVFEKTKKSLQNVLGGTMKIDSVDKDGAPTGFTVKLDMRTEGLEAGDAVGATWTLEVTAKP